MYTNVISWLVLSNFSLLLFRWSFLSINRFERKKNIELAISAFAMLYNSQQDFLQGDNKNELSLIVAGKFRYYLQ